MPTGLVYFEPVTRLILNYLPPGPFDDREPRRQGKASDRDS